MMLIKKLVTHLVVHDDIIEFEDYKFPFLTSQITVMVLILLPSLKWRL